MNVQSDASPHARAVPWRLGVIPSRAATAIAHLTTYRARVVLAGALAGLVVVLVFAHALKGIPPAYWIHRDDGVITMSHARNLVDFGFVGVSPSGERVEGYSAPLQFVVFAIAYAISHVGYARFADLQTIVCGFGLGAALYAVFFLCSRRALAALAGTVVAALLLRQSGTFLVWHASGMENALTHLFYTGTAAVLVLHIERPTIALRWAVIPLLAAWARFESILHIAPMVLAFAAMHYREFRNTEGLRFAGVVVGAWLVLFLGRSWYFGHFVPNTAYAQDIPLSTHVEWLVLGRAPSGRLELAWTFFRKNLGVLLVLVVPLLAVVRAARTTRLIAMLAALTAASAVLNAFLFNSARLDAARPTTFLAPLSVMCVIALVVSLRGWAPRVGALAVLASPIAAQLVSVKPYAVCCAAKLFEDNRAEFVRFRERESLPRPLVASPDLGAVSFHKEVNILDMAHLGSAVLPQLADNRSTNNYVLRIAAPDIIELHHIWADLHRSLLNDPRFRAMYEPWAPQPSAFVWGHCGAQCFWVRKAVRAGAATDERRLIDSFGASHDPALVRAAVERCNASTEADACLYVTRTVYRFLPDLTRTQSDAAREALEAIRDERQRELSRGIVNSRAHGRLAMYVRRYLTEAP